MNPKLANSQISSIRKQHFLSRDPGIADGGTGSLRRNEITPKEQAQIERTELEDDAFVD